MSHVRRAPARETPSSGRRHGNRRSQPLRCLLLAAAFACLSAAASAHPEARNIEELPLKLDRIAHVYAMGYTQLGLDADYSYGRLAQKDGRLCLVGSSFGFDVDDSYAYDIDEPVKVSVTYLPVLTSGSFTLAWDQNGGEGHGSATIRNEGGEAPQTVTVTLDRARFSGQGSRGVDLAFSAHNGQVGICDVKVERSGVTHRPTQFGALTLTIRDEATGAPIPARVGIYDATGRAPIPSDDALPVQRFGDSVRLLSVNQRAAWPSKDRMAFYARGTYRTKLPPGTYQLVVSRGPEYKFHVGSFVVKAGRMPADVTVSLKRYDDMPARGWISGDDHVHLQREEVADERVWQQTAAEDIHVADILQMGNIAGIYFQQPAWGEAGRYTQEQHSLVSGQEDPRTGQLGHTIHENLKQPIHLSSENYFLYYKAFEESHRQGGLSGFAHLGEWFNAQRGLAITVPFGDVDFIEVSQMGTITTDIWYGFMNMGFKMTPSGGADFPYTDLPGVSRQYVQVAPGAGLDAYYQSWRAGHVFVTNGPFLEFTVNGQAMGSELKVKKGERLRIHAEVRLNPDIDDLDRIELVSQGDVIATKAANGMDRITLDTEVDAEASQWLAVRAFGKRQQRFNTVEAHSGATYVIVDGAPFWKRSALPALVAHQKAVLNEILTAPVLVHEDLEGFETNEILAVQWPRQREMLRPRVEQAAKMYDEILVKAGLQPVRPGGTSD